MLNIKFFQQFSSLLRSIIVSTLINEFFHEKQLMYGMKSLFFQSLSSRHRYVFLNSQRN